MTDKRSFNPETKKIDFEVRMTTPSTVGVDG